MAAENVDIVESVLAKYRAAGWIAFRTPAKDGPVDIIAKSPKKMHFVRVIATSNEADAKYGGESKNSFVQNAFSNAAEPVYASVQTGRGKNPDVGPNAPKWITKVKITFKNTNNDARVIV